MAKRAARQTRDMVDINWLPCHSVYGQDLARPHSILLAFRLSTPGIANWYISVERGQEGHID